jgi:mono/diheme cytochrome c family protein
MRSFLLGVVFTIVVIIAAGIFIAKRGYIDLAADNPPSNLETHFAMSAVDASRERHAPEVKNPIPSTEENVVAGAQLYLNNCAGCHGEPSNTNSQFGRSFNPPVPQFFKDSPDMPEHQNFYIIQHGTRWTGMPSWKNTLTTAQTWQIVTFLSKIDKLPPAALKVFEPPATAPASGTTR